MSSYSSGIWKLLLRQICRASFAGRNLERNCCFSGSDEHFLFLSHFPKFALKSIVTFKSIHLNELTGDLCP